MLWETIIQMYAALLVVITLHELGHLPKKIKWQWGIIPKAAAMQALSRSGGLIVNIVLFSLVFFYQPTNVFLQYVGLIAWIHFILYSITGSLIPEPKEGTVNTKTYVFDDVPNKHAVLYISLAVINFFWMKAYYWPIIKGVLGQ